MPRPPLGLFLLELHKVEPKLLPLFLAVFSVLLGVFLLKFLLFMKESLCKGSSGSCNSSKAKDSPRPHSAWMPGDSQLDITQ